MSPTLVLTNLPRNDKVSGVSYVHFHPSLRMVREKKEVRKLIGNFGSTKISLRGPSELLLKRLLL